jgi:tRNA/rRNA methyltransferase
MNTANPLANIRIVLSHTTHPGNIGAAARAMKTMGITSLFLVRPKFFPHADASAMAAGAPDVLEATHVCASLDEALGGTVLAAAVTARRRGLSPEMFTLRPAMPLILQAAQRGNVALVFGTEMSGLSNAEVEKCQLLITIPANPDYPSLNLAAAVQVVCYELRQAMQATDQAKPETPQPASFEEVERFYAALERTLIEIGFLDPARPKRLMQRLRRLFARSRLEKEEVDILRGILKAVKNS